MNDRNDRDPSIGIVGTGILGKGLALALAAKGYQVAGVHNRSPDSARWLADRVPGCRVMGTAQELADRAGLVFITTPDSVITQVSSEIAWRSGQGVAHCCGSASTSILQPAIDQGAVAGAFHPFQTFAGLGEPSDAASRLIGVTFAIAGGGWVADFLRRLAESLEGLPILISDNDRPLYHASGVLVSGHVAALLQSAVEMWRSLGFSQQQAIQSLYPLCRATLEAAAKDGVTASATGPVYRGDVDTLRSHFEALLQRLPQYLPLYGALTAASLPVAVERGVGPARISAIQGLVDHYRGVE